MINDEKDGGLPPDFIDGIQKKIELRKKTIIVTRKKGGQDIDWPKVKENIELLKKKCSDFSQMIESSDSPQNEIELAKIAREIKQMWKEIKLMMDGNGN